MKDVGAVFQELARGLTAAAHDLPKIFGALAASLAPALCDTCAIDLSPTAPAPHASPRQVTLLLGDGELLKASVTVSRREESPELTADDLATIETCIGFATL